MECTAMPMAMINKSTQRKVFQDHKPSTSLGNVHMYMLQLGACSSESDTYLPDSIRTRWLNQGSKYTFFFFFLLQFLRNIKKRANCVLRLVRIQICRFFRHSLPSNWVSVHRDEVHVCCYLYTSTTYIHQRRRGLHSNPKTHNFQSLELGNA